MTESIIKNIQSYHSISFEKKGMTFHQYFNCGKGKFVNYSNLEFQSGLVVVEAFEECVGKLVGKEAKKRTTNRGLNKNLFCEVPGCMLSFANIKDLESHIEDGNHRFTSEITSMDSVKTYYADLIQTSSHRKLSQQEKLQQYHQ